MKALLRASMIAMAIPVLNHLFMGLAGFLQLRSVSGSWPDALRAAAEAPLNYALVPAASVGVIFAVFYPHRARGGSFLESVHVRPLLGGVVALCFVAGLCLQLPLAEIGNLVQELWPISFDELARRHRFVNPKTWSGGMAALLAVVLVAPVTEELVFRGWILPDLSERFGPTTALVVSSVLFGLVHLELSAIVYATTAGLVLGAVALRTGSTLGSIALHAGVNALPLLLPSSLVRIAGFNTLDPDVVHISPWLVALSLGGAGAALLTVWHYTDEPRRGRDAQDGV